MLFAAVKGLRAAWPYGGNYAEWRKGALKTWRIGTVLECSRWRYKAHTFINFSTMCTIRVDVLYGMLYSPGCWAVVYIIQPAGRFCLASSYFASPLTGAALRACALKRSTGRL